MCTSPHMLLAEISLWHAYMALDAQVHVEVCDLTAEDVQNNYGQMGDKGRQFESNELHCITENWTCMLYKDGSTIMDNLEHLHHHVRYFRTL